MAGVLAVQLREVDLLLLSLCHQCFDLLHTEINKLFVIKYREPLKKCVLYLTRRDSRPWHTGEVLYAVSSDQDVVFNPDSSKASEALQDFRDDEARVVGILKCLIQQLEVMNLDPLFLYVVIDLSNKPIK